MSEIKRAQLIPFGTQKQSDKPSKESRKTLRLSVVLPEPNEDTYPEFNYKDELAAAKKFEKRKEPNVVANGLSRSGDVEDDDDDVRRIAKQMEEKYGTAVPTNKKKRKGRKDDYADIGMGYDESDSFIDNTDGYDEMIPQNVTTLHGGFYINSGALEFKTDDEANSDFSSSSSDDESSKKTTSRKRIIESSDETDRENKTESVDKMTHIEKKRKMQNGGNGMQQALKKKLMGSNKIYIKRRRLLDPDKKTVKELLKEKREDLNMSIPPELTAETSIIAIDDTDNKKMSISNVTDIIESVVKGSAKDMKPPVLEEIKNLAGNALVPGTVATTISASNAESSHDPATACKDVKLPENLPGDIVEVIMAIKNLAPKSVDGKNFTPEVNHMVLRLERKCKCLGKPSKMKVYEHLALFINCKTETLIRRAKSLVLDDEQQKLKSLLSALGVEINKIMPALLECHEKESQKVLQKKFSLESADNEEVKSLRMPKRRFQWNDVTKKLLKDILLMKKRCLLMEGKAKEALDAQMATFLKTDIQVLWPEGWMSMNALNKIYTTYADPKRLLGSSPAGPAPATPPAIKPPSTSVSMKNLPQSFNSNNISITPIVGPPKSETSSRVNSITSDITVSKANIDTTINLSMKSLPDKSQTNPSQCDINPTSPKRDLEGKVKVKSASELMKPTNNLKKIVTEPAVDNDDSVIIIDNSVKEKSHKKEDSYGQVIDLSDKNDSKPKPDFKSKFSDIKDTTISPCNQLMSEARSHLSKHHELSITPTYPSGSKVDHPKPKTSCDDIQKVMEDLKVLQKMSSPKKSADLSPTSSAVSVIAVNKSFAPKPVHNSSTMQRIDYTKSDLNSSFQDEFQKQLFSAFNHISANSAKSSYNSIDRFPHIASGSTMVTGDKYYQSANNNYAQNSNGHKSGTPAPHSGTYSILDDMFANLLTQYGYAKEATAPKPHQK